MSPRAGLVETFKLECYVAYCDREKRTLCGGREEGRQDGAKQTFDELLVYCSGLYCACMVFFVRYCVYFHVLHVCMFDVVAQLRAPASLEGGIIKVVQYLGTKRFTGVLAVPLLVFLFVCIVCSLRVVC